MHTNILNSNKNAYFGLFAFLFFAQIMIAPIPTILYVMINIQIKATIKILI